MAFALATTTMARAHDADPAMQGTQPHRFGPYQLVDEVYLDVEADTTTATYTVSLPPQHHRQVHLIVALPSCDDPHSITWVSSGGAVDPNGAPNSGVPGPVIRWRMPSSHAGEAVTHAYRVEGRFEPDEGSAVVRAGDRFHGTVERVGCEPAVSTSPSDGACTLTLSARNDSDVVSALAPPGSPGLRVAATRWCDAGEGSAIELSRQVVVDGQVVALLSVRQVSGPDGGGGASHEVHLPVRMVEQVCLRDPDTPSDEVCVGH